MAATYTHEGIKGRMKLMNRIPSRLFKSLLRSMLLFPRYWKQDQKLGMNRQLGAF
jgi:hypothetical protein